MYTVVVSAGRVEYRVVVGFVVKIGIYNHHQAFIQCEEKTVVGCRGKCARVVLFYYYYKLKLSGESIEPFASKE